MGIYERDYYRGGSGGGLKSYVASTVVGKLLAVNVAVWGLQVIFGGAVTDVLACSAEDLFGGGFPELWRIATANFAHSDVFPMHLVGNMVGLWFFGRELENIYGAKDFLTLYLVAGWIAILCEATLHHFGVVGSPETRILGASGSVMALVVLFATFFPHRTVLLFFVLPVKVWVICALFVLFDVLGTFNTNSNTAHFAHLSGAAFGFAYRYWDLRWESLRARWSKRKTRARRPRPDRVTTRAERAAPSASEPRGEAGRPPSDAVSRRIDELLAKIHREGMGSLSEEERDYLHENYRNYRSS